MKYLLLAAILLLQISQSYAQVNCGTDVVDQALRAASPEYNLLRLRADSILKNTPPAASQQSSNGSSALVINGVHYIPIVVHVIHCGDPIGTTYNPSDQQIIDYVNMLNQGFSASYPGYPSPTTGGQNIGIQFVLAQRAPDCSPTNGIIRRNANDWLTPAMAASYLQFGVNNSAPYEEIAAMSHWSNLDYYNIYIVRGTFGVGNYAYYPTGAATIYDASVISGLAVTNPNANPYVITHELGHAFFLKHIFEDPSGTVCPQNIDCTVDGDEVCDTDPYITTVGGCDPTAINPCTSQPFGNTVFNYMGGGCPNQFTAGQKTRILNTLVAMRASLDTSLGGTSLALVPPTPQTNTPTISISTPQTAYCSNSPVFITATTTYAGANPIYQWKLNGANAGSNSPLFYSNTMNNGDVVTCELTSSYSPTCVTTNTATSNSITITVNNNMQTPSITISTPNTTICATTPITFTATVQNPGPSMPLFDWHVNGFSTNSISGNGSNTSTYTYYPGNGDVVTCKVMASSPCSVNPWFFSNAITITTIPSVQPTISISASDSSVCSGSTITLNATYTNGGTTAPTIFWGVVNSMAGSFASGPGPITITVDTSMDIVAGILVNNTGGVCYYSIGSSSDILSITADTALTAAIAISTADTNFCQGSLVDFAAVAANGGTNPVYNWQVNGLNAGVTTTTFSYVPDDQDVITCELNSNVPCLTANPVVSNSITMQEIDTVMGNISYLQGNGALCEGDTIVLAAAYSNLDTNIITSRQWLVNGNLESSTDTMQYVLVAGNNEILFTAGFLYTPQCMTANPADYFEYTITANALPDPPVITDFGTHLGSNYPNGQNQWYEVNAGMLAGETNQLFYPTNSGFYYSIATVNGCSSKPSDTVQYIVPNSVNGIERGQGDFYPNPSATGEFITPQYLVDRNAIITNNLGQVVSIVKLAQRLSLQEMPSGTYFIRITEKDFNRMYKLVISR